MKIQILSKLLPLQICSTFSYYISGSPCLWREMLNPCRIGLISKIFYHEFNVSYLAGYTIEITYYSWLSPRFHYDRTFCNISFNGFSNIALYLFHVIKQGKLFTMKNSHSKFNTYIKRVQHTYYTIPTSNEPTGYQQRLARSPIY